MKKPICAATCLILASFLAQAAEQTGADPHTTMERSNSTTSNSDMDTGHPGTGHPSTKNSTTSKSGTIDPNTDHSNNTELDNRNLEHTNANNRDANSETNNADNSNANSETNKADNTDINDRDRNQQALTPMDQSNTKADIKVTQAIRKSLMEKEMSTNAKNIKIITRNGNVTLRGPVASAEEKREIAKLAKAVPGIKKVSNQLEVK